MPVGTIVHIPTGYTVTMDQMLSVAGDARIVYFGETHDNAASHRLELQILQSLEAIHPGRQALGMEMFSRSQQKALDRWVAGELDEKSFLRESRWFDNWKMDFAHYRELLEFARARKIPVIALNAEKEQVSALRISPPEKLPASQQAALPQLDLTDPYHRAMAEGIFGGHIHGKLLLDGFIRAQTLWDETMAESVARYLGSPEGTGRHMLVVAGGNHIIYGYGIPRRVFRRLPASYVIIGGHEAEIPPDKQDRLMDVELPDFPMVPYDFLVSLSYDDLPKQGTTLGVMTEKAPGGRGLLIKEVMPSSNAERGGIHQGDIMISIDGETLDDHLDLVYAMNKKKAGSRTKVEIERKGEVIKLEIVLGQ
jgi:uncharacterized iron-regulated protein